MRTTTTLSRRTRTLVCVMGSVSLWPVGAVQAQTAPAPHVRSMAEIEAIALDANHDLRLARLAVDGALAGVLQADTRPNATLSWNAASYSPTNGLGSGNPVSKRVDQILRIDQTIERGDKRALRVSVAQDQLLGKRVDVEEQRRATLQLVRAAFIDLLLAERRIVVLERTQDSYDRSLDAATKRVKAGDLAKADLARLRVDVLKASMARDAAIGDRLRAQIALALLLDLRDDPRTVATDDDWPRFVASPAADDSVEQRPDLVSARLQVRSADKSIDLARAQRIRDVTIGAQVERYPGLGGTGNTVGFGISIPLFTGNDYGGDIAHAIADRDAAETMTAKLRAAALADVADATADLDAATRKLETYRRGLLDAAKAAADSADFAFDRGALGVMDVLDARRTLLSTQLDALDAEAAYARAQAALNASQTRTLTKVAP